jgi:hypothetical protein
MRTTKDLIDELRMEGTHAEVVQLAVGFPQETKFVSSLMNDVDALNELNSLVAKGGHPLGFIRAIRQGERLHFEQRVLPDHTGQAAEIAHQTLVRIIQKTGENLEIWKSREPNELMIPETEAATAFHEAGGGEVVGTEAFAFHFPAAVASGSQIPLTAKDPQA